MDKKLVLSVAGSGKTQLVIDQLCESERILIITYTNENYDNLRTRIIDKFSYFPRNIKLYKYFEFLYNFCCLPLLKCNHNFKGINFNEENFKIRSKKSSKSELAYYQNNSRQLYHRRMALLINDYALNETENRIYKYFDTLFIDEVQDFASHDFDLLLNIAKFNLKIYYVGDFYQHTFDTSRDGNKRKSLHKDYTKFVKEFKKTNLQIDKSTLQGSWRCSKIICNYISKNLGINIISQREDTTSISILDDLKTNQEQAINLFNNDSIVKLFYKNSHKYDCFSNNWGNSKGINNYNDVCVVISKNMFIKLMQHKLNEQTRNKLYVAISRTKNNLYIVLSEFYKGMDIKD